jgi:hypothetical protein
VKRFTRECHKRIEEQAKSTGPAASLKTKRLRPFHVIVCITVVVGRVICAFFPRSALIRGKRSDEKDSCLTLVKSNSLLGTDACHQLDVQTRASELPAYALDSPSRCAQSLANFTEKKLYIIWEK